jgi:hypothetical protein
MEDSRLRPLWRLTKIFLMIKHPAFEAEVHEKTMSGDYVYEKTVS